MSSAEPLTAPPIPKKPRRWLRRSLVIAIALIAAGGALYWWRVEAARWGLEAAVAETDALDPSWRLDDLLKQRRRLADADNSALLIKAAQSFGYVSIGGVANYDQVMEGWKPPLPLSHLQRELIRGELAKMPKSLALLRQIKERPYGSFPLNISPDFISTLVPHVQNAREVMDCLQHDALLRANDESVTASLESCHALLNTSRSLADEPFLISHLVRVAGQSIFVVAAERCLSQGEATPESLATLQAAVALEIRESDWLFALRGERAGVMMFLENMGQSPLKFRQLKQMRGFRAGAMPARWQDFVLDYFPSTVQAQLPEHLRYMNRLLEAAKLPLHEQADALAKIDADLPRQPVVTQALAPAVMKISNANRRSQSYLRSTLVALACERHRMQHKAWPEALDQLVAAKLLDAVPLDPYDGKPLRLSRTKWGIVVYAIGADGVDDGGNIDRDHPDDPGADLGFRLWDLPRRKGGVP